MGLFSLNKNKANKCPYCGFVFGFTPQNKVICPECNCSVFVLKTKKGVQLLKEEDHMELIVIHHVDSLGFSKKQYEKFKKEFLDSAKTNVTLYDVHWALFGHLLKEKAKSDDYEALNIIYSQMASMQINEPSEYLKLRKLAGQMELLSYQKNIKTPFEIEILPTKNSCDYCKTFSKKRYTLERAISELPLPLMECTQGAGCRCCYGIIPKDH